MENNNLIVIKPARTEDAEIFWQWGQETEELWFNEETKWYPSVEMVRNLIKSPKSIFLAPYDGNKPFGMIVIHNLVVWGYIDTLYVAPGYRRKGFAKQLIEEAHVRLKSDGISLAYLHMIEDNEVARNFYLSQGYKPGCVVQFFEKSI